MKWFETAHIAVAVVTITFAFTLIPGFAHYSFLNIFFTVGAGFVLHELGHRFVAKGYGAKAQFIVWTWGLVLALALAAGLGIVFAAPGAVYVWGKKLSKEQTGLMKLAGPGTNLLLALGFASVGHALFPSDVATLGAQVNASLALFNLLPFDPIDGGAIYQWSPAAWGAAVLAALAAVVYL
jgi:Zn-dependent protease